MVAVAVLMCRCDCDQVASCFYFIEKKRLRLQVLSSTYSGVAVVARLQSCKVAVCGDRLSVISYPWIGLAVIRLPRSTIHAEAKLQGWTQGAVAAINVRGGARYCTLQQPRPHFLVGTSKQRNNFFTLLLASSEWI